jgi:hypothetical protein
MLIPLFIGHEDGVVGVAVVIFRDQTVELVLGCEKPRENFIKVTSEGRAQGYQGPSFA